jgi:hypothetical protein
MKRTWLVAALLCAGCTERERPDPYGPGSTPQLTAEVVAPRTGNTTTAGAIVLVRARASERGLRLTGVGFVARRFNAERIDSAIVTFPARADSTHDFALRIPPNLPPNTQIDITALGASGTFSARSATQSIVIVLR